MSGVSTLISILNDAAVSIFGGVLSACFCGALGSRRQRALFWLGMSLLLIPQGAVYLLWDARFRMEIYPIVLHLPLLILLRALTGKWLWPLISILSAYLFCQIRRYTALLAAALLPGGDDVVQKLSELIVTLPLLLLLLRFAAPAIRQMMERSIKVQCQFGIIAAIYYAFDYISRVYTDILSTGAPIVVEFMPTVCGAAYLCFLAYNSAEEKKRSMLQQVQGNLKLQVSQAVREISALRESQAQAKRYRHDLRHHMQYLLSCIENGQEQRAVRYINEVCAELAGAQVVQYCENEPVNLVLASFARRAEKAGICLAVSGGLPAILAVSDSDLCVVLSNALENAIHACLRAGEPRKIELSMRCEKRTGKIFLQITNPFSGDVRFEKGIPVSRQEGHGIGVRSICAVTERYGGGCSFSAEGGKFTLRVFL